MGGLCLGRRIVRQVSLQRTGTKLLRGIPKLLRISNMRREHNAIGFSSNFMLLSLAPRAFCDERSYQSVN